MRDQQRDMETLLAAIKHELEVLKEFLEHKAVWNGVESIEEKIHEENVRKEVDQRLDEGGRPGRGEGGE